MLTGPGGGGGGGGVGGGGGGGGGAGGGGDAVVCWGTGALSEAEYEADPLNRARRNCVCPTVPPKAIVPEKTPFAAVGGKIPI